MQSVPYEKLEAKKKKNARHQWYTSSFGFLKDSGAVSPNDKGVDNSCNEQIRRKKASLKYIRQL
jgi:hypothetical protein